MISIGNGANLSTRAGPWRQHWSVLLGTFIRDLVIVCTLGAIALYAEWPWPSLLVAPLGFVPSWLAYVRWQHRCLFLTATDITVELGVLSTHAISFPIREIEALEARKTLLGMVFDYGDITICSGPKSLTFEKLHPFHRFVATYQAYQRLSARRFEPAGGHSLPLPLSRGDVSIEGRYRRLD